MLPTAMSWRRWLTGLLVVLLLAFCAIEASPLDTAWIAGLWDDGDHDNVAILPISIVSAADLNRVDALRPVQPMAPRAFSPTPSRAPPVHA
jgi:hypothetical protein